MKVFCLLLVLSTFSVKSYCQTDIDKFYSNSICNCYDSLKQIKAISNITFPLCFQKAIERNPLPFIEECLRIYGDTSEQIGYQFGKVFAERMSISLVNNCRPYFLITDSLRYEEYKYLNKDSLKKEVSILESKYPGKREKSFFDNRGLLYFQMGLYNNALDDINIVLKEDPNNVKNIFTKAWINEIQGNFTEAILLYKQAADLSKIKGFEIFTEIATRKKNGI